MRWNVRWNDALGGSSGQQAEAGVRADACCSLTRTDELDRARAVKPGTVGLRDDAQPAPPVLMVCDVASWLHAIKHTLRTATAVDARCILNIL